MPMLGSHLAITSSIAMLYATLRLVDYSVLKWTTADFPESDFPKKQFLMDYLRWKADEPVLGVALLPTVILFAIAKFDVVVNIVTRAIQVAGGSQSFALRHLFDLFDITVLAITLALYKMLGPSGTELIETCDSIAEFRWNARAVRPSRVRTQRLPSRISTWRCSSSTWPPWRCHHAVWFATPAEK